MFTNLISNAVRYNVDNGSIFISSKIIDKKFIKIKISDTGIGIPEKDLNNIFAEFYRAENAKKVVNFGTGLGLSFVRQIIENYSGTIKVQSELEKGTVFTIKLPVMFEKREKLNGKREMQ